MSLDIHLDCHMHSTYSDGSRTIDQVVSAAVEKGLRTIAITDHMPMPFATRYAMDRNRLTDYRREIARARSRYGEELTILTGLEMEYLPQHRDWIREIADMGWDLLLISIHGIVTDQGQFMVNGNKAEFLCTLNQLFNGDFQAFCTRYYTLIQEAVATGWFDVAAHMDVIKKFNQGNRYFNETDPWYRSLVCQTLDALADNHVKLEINTNGINHPAAAPYPSEWILHEALVREIPLVLGSDSHDPKFQGQYFGQFQAMVERLKEEA